MLNRLCSHEVINHVSEEIHELAKSVGLVVEPTMSGFKLLDWDGAVLWEKFSDVEFLQAYCTGYLKGLSVKRIYSNKPDREES